MIAQMYPSVIQAVWGRGYAGCLDGYFQGHRGEAMQDLGYYLPRILIPRTPVNSPLEGCAASTEGAKMRPWWHGDGVSGAVSRLRRAWGESMNDTGGRRRRSQPEAAWERYMLAEQRALLARAEGILAQALVEALPEESREELDRWAQEDRRLAKEGLVELMDEEGEIYQKHIDELDPWDVADRLRADTARSDWLAMRTRERIVRREARLLFRRARRLPPSLPISSRELEILKGVARGLSNHLLAEEVHLSQKTVKRHLANIYSKIGISSRGEAVAKGVAEGWLALEDIISEDFASDEPQGQEGQRYRCVVDGCAREVVVVRASREEDYRAPPSCHGRQMGPVVASSRTTEDS
jgi:DNA-binding CsgD family transcriptional regulator